jgi:hypothetical protein
VIIRIDSFYGGVVELHPPGLALVCGDNSCSELVFKDGHYAGMIFPTD